MVHTITESREIPVKGEYDLIVSGGGIAGIAAALAGARQGLRVMLIEKSVMLGGLATLGLVNYYEPLCDGNGKLLVTGIAEELLHLSIRHGYDTLGEQWKIRASGASAEFSTEPDTPRYATRFNPSVFTLFLNDLVTKEKIELRYDLLASYPVMKGTHCTGIITESTEGREYFSAKVVVDATGDAGIAARAGIPYRTGVNYMTYFCHGSTPGNMEKALEANDMALMDDRYFHCGSDLKGKGHPDKLPFFTGVENSERSEYVRYGQRMLLEKIKAKPKNETYLYTLPGMIQLRKTRCIIGNETFLAEDGKHSETSIGATGDFRYKYRRFEFPFGMIYNKEFPNILAAGRVASAEDDGWEISRMIPSAALTGEAAGVAAALMIRQGKTAAELKVADVQKLLEKNNVKLRF